MYGTMKKNWEDNDNDSFALLFVKNVWYDKHTFFVLLGTTYRQGKKKEILT